MSLLTYAASIVILVHCTCMASKLNHRNWYGHKLQFTGLALSYSAICGGAAAFMFGWTPGLILLLIGMAGKTAFDRREHT